MPTLEQDYETFKQERLGQSVSPSTQASESLIEDYQRFRELYLQKQATALSAIEQERAAGGAIRQAPPVDRFPGGALVGGVLPFLLPGGALSQAARLGLSLAGAGVGEAGQQGVEALLGVPGGPSTIQERLAQIGREAAIQGVAGTAGGGIERLLRAGGGALKRPIAPQAKQAVEFATRGAPLRSKELLTAGSPFREMPLTVAQMTESPTLEMVENIAAGSITGQPTLEAFKQQGQKAVDATARVFSDALGKQLPKPMLGDAIVATIQRTKEAARVPAKAIYKAIDEATQPIMRPQQIVDTVPIEGILGAKGEPLTRQVTRMVQERVNPAPIRMDRVRAFATPLREQSKEINRIAPEVGGDALVEALATLPDDLTYGAAQALRSRLLATKDAITLTAKKAPAIGILSQAISQVDAAIDRGLGRFNPELRTAWRKANEIWAGTNEKYNNDLIKGLVQAAERYHGGTPEKVFDLVFRRGAESDLLRLKSALGANSSLWGSFKRQGWETLFERAGLTEETSLIGKKLEGELRKMGERTLAAVFDPAEMQWMRQFANLAEQHQKVPTTGLGRMLIQMKQANLAVQLGATGFAIGKEELGTAGAFLIMPAVIAKLATKPLGRDLLIQGMTTPISNPKAGQILGRLLATLGEGAAPRTEEPPVAISPSRPMGLQR